MSKSVAEMMEDILGGPPPADPSDTPSYTSGGGGDPIQFVDKNKAPLRAKASSAELEKANSAARFNTLECRFDAVEELIRRVFGQISEFEIRMRQVEDRLGTNRGLKI